MIIAADDQVPSDAKTSAGIELQNRLLKHWEKRVVATANNNSKDGHIHQAHNWDMAPR